LPIEIRTASTQDADNMALLINRIISIGGTTGYREPFDAQKIRSEFLPPNLGICCHVAVDEQGCRGFQALLWCDPEWEGDHKLPADWAVIATYVDPDAHGQGIGRKLFERTAAAATHAGVRFIDATIRRENSGGLGYYGSMGFAEYRSTDEAVSKRFAPG